MERRVNIDLSKNTIHHMMVWSYAYKQARKGEWEMYARDRARFRRRIDEAHKSLSPILDSTHRHHIYLQRFASV